jgi:heavy metal sensor kinase
VSTSLNTRLRGDFQWASAMVDERPDGTFTWFEPEGFGDEESPWLQVWNERGELLYRNSEAQRRPVPESRTLAIQADNRTEPVTIPTSTVPVRVLSLRGRIGSKPVVIQVARWEAEAREQVREVALILIFGLPLGVAAAGLGGYTLARRALLPVERMTERARTITAENLHDRLPVHNPDDEMGRLATVFNQTLARLEASFEQMRRFTADVSHELRTPLTAIRSVGEVGLREHRDEGAYRGIIGSMLEEVDRLAGLVDRLLTLSRADTGRAKLSADTIDLGELAEDVAAHLGVLAEEKRQTITVDVDGHPHALGDRLVVRQAIINLVDNAIKFSPSGGRISLTTREAGGRAMLEVHDSGPGISSVSRSRVFDRFYREEPGLETPDPALGTRDSGLDVQGGAGLGLSIAKWAVEANGGELSLAQTSADGSTFRITLPRAVSERRRATG